MSKWLRRGFGGNSPSAPSTSATVNGDGDNTSNEMSSAVNAPVANAMSSSTPQAPPPSSNANNSNMAMPNVAPPPSYYSSNYAGGKGDANSAGSTGGGRSVRSRSAAPGGQNNNYSSYGQAAPPPPPNSTRHYDQHEEVVVHQNKQQRDSNRAADPGGSRTRSASIGRMGKPGSVREDASGQMMSQPPTPGSQQQPPPNGSGYDNYGKNGVGGQFGSHPTQEKDANSNYSSSQQQQQQRRPAYLLHRDLVIGKGSYGQVCIASRGEAEGGRAGKRKKFACKCVMLRSDPKYIAKLQEEVNVLRELRGHDNVIRLYDVFCVDNELFIITELGRGGDLFHLLTTHPKHGVTEAYAAKTVAQMLSAVAFLHSRNICHRDLKLENWVLESGKDVWSPLKLIDFGLSTHFTPGHRLSRVVGSSYYVAPEVLKKSYTEACDLWSLGVIVYMLLSGAPPFYGRTDEAIKASIVNGEYTFPHELFRDVSDDAMAFVSTLLSYNTEYRYTADQALTHPWLSANCDPEILRRAKEGAQGRHQMEQPEPMQM